MNMEYIVKSEDFTSPKYKKIKGNMRKVGQKFAIFGKIAMFYEKCKSGEAQKINQGIIQERNILYA